MAEKATPRPWNFEPEMVPRPFSREHTLRIYAEDPGPAHDFHIGYVMNVDDETRKANARLIVQAVNSHDALVDALEAAVAEHTAEARRANFDACGCTNCARFKAALALAKQEAQ